MSEAGSQVSPSSVQRVVDWPLPQTGKQLKQFLGFIGYYWGFIPDIADLTYEMNEMKKAVKVSWTPAEVRRTQEKISRSPSEELPELPERRAIYSRHRFLPN